jgi:hypothetical protein
MWHRLVTRGGLTPRLKLAHGPVGDLLITCARIIVAPRGSVSWRAIPHVAALMRATCLEEAGGYCRRQPHAEHDQNEVAEGAEAAQSFRLRTAKAVGDDAIHQKANRQGDQKDEQH